MTDDDFVRDLAQIYPDTDDHLARLHARLAEAAQADGVLDIAYRVVDSPLGPLLLAATNAGLVRVAFNRENHDAVVVAMATAGNAVLFSGVTVAIGLLALIVLPVPFMRSMGYGGALIPLASVMTTLSLTPAILGGIGPRVDWPKLRHENRASRGWSRCS